MTAAIINVGPSGDRSSGLELAGVAWVRQTGIVDDALGVLTFLIGDEEAEPFWATAPVIIPTHARLRPHQPSLSTGRS